MPALNEERPTTLTTAVSPAIEKFADGASSRIQTLDCLRAVACLVVILSHTQKITTPGNWTIGAYGVGLFCVLSGYLITSILLKDETAHGKIDLSKFLQRRCLRIVPAYFALLVPCAVLLNSGSFLKNHRDVAVKTLSELPYYATFTHNLGDGIAINHLWSISIEEQFYCFLPVMLIVVASLALRQSILAAIALLLMPFALLGAGDPHYCNAAFISLVTGSLLAFNMDRVSKVLNSLHSAIILVCSAVLFAASMLARLCPYGPLCSIAFALIIWLAVTRGKISPKLNSLAYVGRISYGVYLVQMPISLVTYWLMDKYGLAHFVPVTFTINVAASVLVGAISWELFEKRILSLRTAIEGKTVGLVLASVTPILLCIGVALHLMHL